MLFLHITWPLSWFPATLPSRLQKPHRPWPDLVVMSRFQGDNHQWRTCSQHRTLLKYASDPEFFFYFSVEGWSWGNWVGFASTVRWAGAPSLTWWYFSLTGLLQVVRRSSLPVHPAPAHIWPVGWYHLLLQPRLNITKQTEFCAGGRWSLWALLLETQQR